MNEENHTLPHRVRALPSPLPKIAPCTLAGAIVPLPSMRPCAIIPVWLTLTDDRSYLAWEAVASTGTSSEE